MRTWFSALKESLLFRLVCLGVILILLQGIAGYLTEWKEPWIQSFVSIAGLVVGIGTTWFLTSLAAEQKTNTNIERYIQAIKESFASRRKETFEAAVKWYLELSKDYRKIFAHDPELSKLYFDWLVERAVAEEWKKAWGFFTEIDPRFCGYEPLASVYKERLTEENKMEELVRCLKQMPVIASLGWLSFNRVHITEAQKSNGQLNVRLVQFALNLKPETPDEQSLYKYVVKDVLGGELKPFETDPDERAWFQVVGIDYERAKDALRGRTELEPENLIGAEYSVQFGTPNIERYHVAVTAKRGQGKTFAKRQLKAECQNKGQVLFVEWENWKVRFDEETLSVERLREGFLEDCLRACQAHDELKWVARNTELNSQNLMQMLNQTNIEKAFLVLDLGNKSDFRPFDEAIKKMELFLNALPTRDLFTGNPRFYWRIFCDHDLLEYVSDCTQEHIQEQPIIWSKEQKIELLKKRIKFVKSNVNQEKDPYTLNEERAAKEKDFQLQLLVDQFIPLMQTPHDIVSNLWRIMEEQARCYKPDDPDSENLSTQVLDQVLEEWRKSSRV